MTLALSRIFWERVRSMIRALHLGTRCWLQPQHLLHGSLRSLRCWGLVLLVQHLQMGLLWAWDTLKRGSAVLSGLFYSMFPMKYWHSTWLPVHNKYLEPLLPQRHPEAEQNSHRTGLKATRTKMHLNHRIHPPFLSPTVPSGQSVCFSSLSFILAFAIPKGWKTQIPEWKIMANKCGLGPAPCQHMDKPKPLNSLMVSLEVNMKQQWWRRKSISWFLILPILSTGKNQHWWHSHWWQQTGWPSRWGFPATLLCCVPWQPQASCTEWLISRSPHESPGCCSSEQGGEPGERMPQRE